MPQLACRVQVWSDTVRNLAHQMVTTTPFKYKGCSNCEAILHTGQVSGWVIFSPYGLLNLGRHENRVAQQRGERTWPGQSQQCERCRVHPCCPLPVPAPISGVLKMVSTAAGCMLEQACAAYLADVYQRLP